MTTTRTAELGRKLVGALLDAKEPKRLLLAAGLHPEDLGDRFLASCWTVIGQIAQDGQRVDAPALFAAGITRKMLSNDDLGLLVSLQGRNVLDERAFLTIAEELRREARKELLGRQLTELGAELLNRKATIETSYARFKAIGETYAQLHARGRRGSDVVVAAVEEFERRKREGRPGMITTGLPALDKLTGGLPLKLAVVLGPPGTFKSGLMGTMLRRQLAAGVRPLVVSLEDRDTWVVKRYAAADLGMKVRDVFAKDFPDEAKAAETFNALSNELHESWFVTKQHVRTADDVVRVATQYKAQHDINLVYVDNARAVKAPESKFAEDRRLAQSRMYELFAGWSDQSQVPLVLLAHTSRKYFERTHGRGPPVMSDIGETSDAEKDVRLLLALWKKRRQLRITIGKQNEGDVEDSPTIELGMLGESALIDAESGVEVNLRQEEREERERTEDAKEERARKRIVEREAWNTSRKATKLTPVEEKAQTELGLEVQPASKPAPIIVREEPTP